MITKSSQRPDFGAYPPKKNTRFLRALIRVGLSRGEVTRWLKKVWVRVPEEIVDVKIRGVKYRLHIGKNATDFKLLTTSKYYEKTEIKALVAPEAISGKKRVFVDLGANTGYYSLEVWSHGFDQVLAVEPNPPALEILRDNIRLNDAEKKIAVAPVCVGPEGEVDFYTSGTLGTASALQANHGQCEAIQVSSKPLKQLLEEHGIENITSLKIDVEGYEDRALIPFFESAPESLWPLVIVIEHCNASDWNEDVLSFLQKNGYGVLSETRGNMVFGREAD